MFKQILRHVTFFIITLIILAMLGGVMIEHSKGIMHISQSVRENYVYWMICRYSLMVIFVGFYPTIIQFVLAKRSDLTTEIINKYARRRYAVLFCVFYEVILVHNVLSWLISALLR